MEDSLYIHEAVNFFKRNWKKYLISLGISFLIVGLLYLYSTVSQSSLEKSSMNNSFSFEFLVENKEGNSYSKVEAIKEVFVKELAKKEKNISVEEALNNIEMTYSDTDGKITVNIRDAELADDFFNFIDESKVEFFDNKNVYLLSDSVNKNTIDNINLETMNLKKMIIYLFTILFLTFLIGTILSALFDFKKETISQKFTLKAADNIIDMNRIEGKTNEEIIHALSSIIKNPNINKIVVMEDSSELKNKNFTKNIFLVNSLENVKELTFVPEKVLLVCKKDETKKQWIAMQLELAKNYSSTVECVFI